MAAAARDLTDRAHRYRANQNAPEGPRVCSFCGSKKNVEVEHIDGHEEHGEPDNLMWLCRSCNTAKGFAMKKAGIGRLTKQYNPAGGATSLGEWMNAVGAITPTKGEKYAAKYYGVTSTMSVPDAVAMIRATPQSKRKDFAAQLRRHNPKSPVKKAAKQLLDTTDAISGGLYDATVGLPAKIARGLIENPEGQTWHGYRFDVQNLNDGTWETITTVRAFSAKQAVNILKQRSSEWSKGKKLRAKRANPKEKKNPAGSSDSMYEAFHGKPATKEIAITEAVHEHGNLAAIGVLVNLKVRTLSGLDVTLGTSDEKQSFDETVADPNSVYLASNEEGTQLYFVGGDQSVQLDTFKMDTPEWRKDDMILGVLYELTYRTKKKFDKFKLTEYYHELGEETGVQPLLRYEPLSPKLYVTGGQYRIEIPAFGVSPGIEN